jgi:hypothetical protein
MDHFEEDRDLNDVSSNPKCIRRAGFGASSALQHKHETRSTDHGPRKARVRRAETVRKPGGKCERTVGKAEPTPW